MFGLGHWELLAIVGVVVLIFGPSMLPKLGRAIGEGVHNLKKGLSKGDGRRDGDPGRMEPGASASGGEETGETS